MGILDELIDAGDVVNETLWDLVNQELEDLAALGAGAGGTDVRNGDFELDTDIDGIPNFWTDDGTSDPFYGGHGDVYPGGTVAFETTSPLNGSQSIKMVHPGGASNGGGLLESDFMSCSEVSPFVLSWLHKSSAAGMKNEVITYWYDKDQVDLGGTPSTTIYNSTTNPTATTQYIGLCIPPAGALFFTIGLVGGFTDTDVAGTAYFDSVTRYPLTMMNFNAPTLGTIAGGAGTSSWASKGTVAVESAVRADKTEIYATIYGISNDPSTTGRMRLSVGTDYSEEVIIPGSGSGSITQEVYLTTDTLGGAITLSLDAIRDGGTGTIQVSMNSPDGKYKLSDEALI